MVVENSEFALDFLTFITLLKKINLLSDYLKVITFFLECITSTDCPAGGTNYVCSANECNCPMPKVLDGNKCVGKLKFEKKLLKYELQF